MGEQRQNSQAENTENVESAEKTEEAVSTKKKWKWNIPLLILEFFVLLIAIGVLYVITTTTREIERTNIDTEKIVINDEVVETKTEKKQEEVKVSKGYRNIALFGVDARDGELGKGSRSDTIMIANINLDTHEIKLISVYRDTYLNLGNDSYNKCNGAYARGGPEQAITMLNMNLDMDITDYVTVGFSGLIEAIDALGGIEIEVTQAEINHLNNYQLCMA
ncbi:MAG: LCP family protein, partial [Lachnospiraceae bacterium]|nr:LCP family protein [Lachnospiraceae bacterium]